jgi:hypothetical protein
MLSLKREGWRDDSTLEGRGPGEVSSSSKSGGSADMPAPALCATSGREQLQQGSPLFDHLIGADK